MAESASEGSAIRYIAEQILEGVRLLPHDPYLGSLIRTTLRLAFEATLIAMVLGLPVACAIGLGRSRRSRWGMIAANAGLGLPPVAVGVYGSLLLTGSAAPWGGDWVGTLNGMVLGQVVLALPIIIAVSAVAIRGLPDALVEQARAFGASGWRLWMFTLREAKVGVVSAVIVAMGSAIGEVGAIALLGGNSEGTTATLATETLRDAMVPFLPAAVEHVLVLLALMVPLGVTLTIVQHWGARDRRANVRRRPVPGIGA